MNFWILPLWTSVTDLRRLSMAYWYALRMRRSEPSMETGLMPIADDSGKRIFFTFISRTRKSITFLASGDFAGHSMPA